MAGVVEVSKVHPSSVTIPTVFKPPTVDPFFEILKAF
jgi:hypothetical protein